MHRSQAYGNVLCGQVSIQKFHLERFVNKVWLTVSWTIKEWFVTKIFLQVLYSNNVLIVNSIKTEVKAQPKTVLWTVKQVRRCKCDNNKYFYRSAVGSYNVIINVLPTKKWNYNQKHHDCKNQDLKKALLKMIWNQKGMAKAYAEIMLITLIKIFDNDDPAINIVALHKPWPSFFWFHMYLLPFHHSSLGCNFLQLGCLLQYLHAYVHIIIKHITKYNHQTFPSPLGLRQAT